MKKGTGQTAMVRPVLPYGAKREMPCRFRYLTSVSGALGLTSRLSELAIGVSNFRPHHLEALAKTARIAPQVNQIRLCPGDIQEETVAYCRERQILPEAYSPLGTGRIFDVPVMQELAKKYDRSIAQICIRWSLQRGYLPLPKSVTPSRIRENLRVFDFSLTDEDVQRIAELRGCVGYANDPDHTVF